MKKLFLAVFLVFQANATAYSAEHDGNTQWSGLYAGAHLGGFFGDVRLSGNMIANSDSSGVNGFIGGALVGYNFRNGNLVFGPEADIGWTNADGTGTATPPPTGGTPPPPPPPPTGGTPPPAASGDSFKYDVGLVGHARLRAGFLFTPETLIFGAGGLAFADVDVTEIGIGGSSSVTGSDFFGWTIGGGIERMIGGRTSARVEYLYDDFGSRSQFDGTESYKARVNAHIIRAVISIRLN